MSITKPSDNTPSILLDNLTIGIDSQTPIFERINLCGSESELIALIGPNGIGKSTLLKTCINFLKPVSGKIFINTRPLHKFQSHELSATVSFVSSKIQYNVHQRVYDFVALGRTPFMKWTGRLSKHDESIIKEALLLTDLIHFQHRYMDELSDGERQRVAIARALAQNTPLILMDEPTAYLDIGNKIILVDLLHHLCKTKNKTIVFSTHDLQIALCHADKIWFLAEEGASEAAPEDMMLHNRFKSLYHNLKSNYNLITGQFEYLDTGKHTFKIWSTANAFDWLSKALLRNGYSASKALSQQDADIEYFSENETYLWKIFSVNRNTPEGFHSIYDLIKFINVNY